ncbi:MAG: histidine phosphatase family protein [Micrococcales bacterium]|nr:histidine phosphatase family protein [Micrococcales bacterium]
MTDVHLVRHGETVWHAENRYAGSTDVPLTERGRMQAQELARWAAGAGLTRVLSSDLGRARDTATLAADAAGLPLEIDSRLREIDFGRAEGLTAAEMDAAFPEARAAFLAAPATSPLPGGEPGAVVADRMLAALADAIRGTDGPVLIVGHTTAIRLALCALLGLPLDGYRDRFPSLHNAALTTVRLPQHGDLRGAGALLALNAPAVPRGG